MSPSITAWAEDRDLARIDFNGDGLSDILWLRQGMAYSGPTPSPPNYVQTNTVSNWLGTASGGFVNNDANAFEWLTAFHSFQYCAAGDFNGDGRTDALWFIDREAFGVSLANDRGGLAIFTQMPSFRMDDPHWKIVGVGDFNGDHIDDLLWRNDDGTLTNWLGTASGNFVVNNANALQHVSNDWHVTGVGDFDGDGRSDILWQSDSGLMSNWLGTASGGFAINDQNALFNARAWGVTTVGGIGDFNGDGRDDVLFREGDQLHLMETAGDGAFLPAWSIGFVARVPQAWGIEGTGDYNGDGIDDILWRNANGVLSDWLGTSDGYRFRINDAAAMIGVSTDWHIADPFQMW